MSCSRFALPSLHCHFFPLLRRSWSFTTSLRLNTSSLTAVSTASSSPISKSHSRVPGEGDCTPPSTSLTLSHHQRDQISLYVDALLEWNQKMNLTAVKDESEVMTRHVEDSLAILPPLKRAYSTKCSGSPYSDGLSLVDVGSGAGLPGLILAIACPGWKFTLLESMRKRCAFLEHVIELVGLSNVNIVCDRAENVGQSPDFREGFDVAVARAVAELRILAEYCIPLVRVGGLFVAAKGNDPQDEIKNAKKAVHLLGASILESCTDIVAFQSNLMGLLDKERQSFALKTVLLPENIHDILASLRSCHYEKAVRSALAQIIKGPVDTTSSLIDPDSDQTARI